ncbi:MAG TPA: AsnC family transcriptional regulator [Stenomitos sp.]
MDSQDRAIINALQGGFPICDRPYARVAEGLGLSEDELIRRLEALLEAGTLSRFGPMYHAERMGGSLILTAMQVPSEDFERVAEQVNAMPEIAHNYEREHDLNMWFVVATGTPEEAEATLARIEAETGYPVYPMPKLKEYYVGLRLEA